MIAVAQPNFAAAVNQAQEYTVMMIFMLAAAMTVAMLIATLFGLHHEAVHKKNDPNRLDRFGFRH